MPFVLRAQIGQMAENRYFAKPSGLLDQMASAAGGMVAVDFQDPAQPVVEALPFDFAEKGLALVVVGTGGSHADLTADYAAIPKEMREIARCLGQETLRGITMKQVLENVGYLREHSSDRAVLRAIHFIQENDRALDEVMALKENRMEDFLNLIIASGQSSFMYLQNVYARPKDQSLSLALSLAEILLKGKGAWRIHGGGFAGTTLNFVPQTDVPAFVATMENAFGKGCCHVLNIRPVGAAQLCL
jgi:galactokinase